MIWGFSDSNSLAVSFKAYDLDGNGFITKDELALMFRSAWIAGFFFFALFILLTLVEASKLCVPRMAMRI